ncbi:MAG TPA: hypothetical protein VFP36_02960 [Usitatibacter sp.]|nr:hypothetical protein [Usitatibacter sp.]
MKYVRAAAGRVDSGQQNEHEHRSPLSNVNVTGPGSCYVSCSVAASCWAAMKPSRNFLPGFAILFLAITAATSGEGGPMRGRTHNSPQAFVVCTGWHALCSASYECKVRGDMADCDCLRVDENHIVATGEIQDAAVKRLTHIRCTDAHPCDVDEAPVCKAISSGLYEVDDRQYDWVSTFSYRGWCGLLGLVRACDPAAAGYAGDSSWAVCDAAPCTENPNPSNPEKPLTCQCRVVANVPFLGTNGRCTGDNGGIMSSSPLEAWDFQANSYRWPLPGLEYVRGACAAVKSDPPPKRVSDGPR